MKNCVALPPLMQQAINKAKKQGILPRNFKPNTQEAKSMRDIHKAELINKLNKEELFRLSYVPFVIAALVWDLAESVCDAARLVGNPATKKLARAVKSLHADYNYHRSRFIDNEHVASEETNMFVFQRAVSDIIHLYTINLRCDISREYPNLESRSIDLLDGVYQCLVIMRALFRYTNNQSRRLRSRLDFEIREILPPEVYKLEPLIEAYAGDKPISAQFQSQQEKYISTLATQIALIELNELKTIDE